MKGSFQFGASVLFTRPGLKETFVTLTLAEKLTPPSSESAKKTSSEVMAEAVLNRLSYQSTSIIPPYAAIVVRKCWSARTSFTSTGIVEEDHTSVDRVTTAIEIRSLL